MISKENEISAFLESLPDETDVSYPFIARDFFAGLDKPENCLINIIKNEVAYDEKIRFNALYCLLAIVWQNRDYGEYRQLVDKYANSFQGNHIYLLTFKSQYYSCLGKNAGNCQLALEYALEAKKQAPYLPNVLHLFTFVIIDLIEVTGNKVAPKLLIEAEDSINKAIAINKGTYARYYATKADLLGKIGRFSEARELIQKAIEIEPSDGAVYALRIGTYQEIRLKILFGEHSKLLNQKQKESVEKLEEVRLKVVELLGLLSAIIAFLVTSIQIGKGLVFQEAARLMVISGGVILIIFSAYSIIFFGEKPKPSQLIVLIFGALMILTFLFPDIIQLLKKSIL